MKSSIFFFVYLLDKHGKIICSANTTKRHIFFLNCLIWGFFEYCVNVARFFWLLDAVGRKNFVVWEMAKRIKLFFWKMRSCLANIWTLKQTTWGYSPIFSIILLLTEKSLDASTTLTNLLSLSWSQRLKTAFSTH